jgi:membrane protein implicated in regulation of membrane protease activity
MPLEQSQSYFQHLTVNQAQPFTQTGIRQLISNIKSRGRNWSFWHGKLIAEGYLSAVDPVRDFPVPFDLGWTMFVLSMVLVALGILAATAMMAVAVAIILLILGVGGLCIAPILLPMIGAILFPLYNTLRGNRKAPMVEFRVEDELTGQPISIVMFLRHGSSNVRLGDRVRVYGSRQWFTSLLRANHVKVVETNRQTANYNITGFRPWPFFIGLISLALVLYGYWWLFL